MPTSFKTKITNQLSVIDFSNITAYVKEYKKDARLISSISARDDIEELVPDKIESIAASTAVNFIKEA